MLTFIVENWGSLVAGLAVAGVVTAVIVKIVRDKKRGAGGCGCGCGCDGCPSAGMCHRKPE